MATATPTDDETQVRIRQTQCFIGGEWVPARSGRTFETIDPANGRVIGGVLGADIANHTNQQKRFDDIECFHVCFFV